MFCAWRRAVVARRATAGTATFGIAVGENCRVPVATETTDSGLASVVVEGLAGSSVRAMGDCLTIPIAV